MPSKRSSFLGTTTRTDPYIRTHGYTCMTGEDDAGTAIIII